MRLDWDACPRNQCFLGVCVSAETSQSPGNSVLVEGWCSHGVYTAEHKASKKLARIHYQNKQGLQFLQLGDLGGRGGTN